VIAPALALLLQAAPAAPAVAPRHLVLEYQALANVTYAVAGGIELKLDVYKPRAAGSSRPVLVFVHGGGWVSGAKEDAVLWLVPWLQAGWAAVNVEYRLARVAHAPAAVEDVRCALRWVHRYGADHGLDVSRIVMSGDSAGAHLALMAALAPESAGLDRGCTVPYPAGTNSWVSVPPRDVKPAAVVAWYPITDVAAMLSGPGARGYAIEWIGNRRDAVKAASLVSPIEYVAAGAPPVITIHGEADPVVPFAQARTLHAALDKAGVKNRLVAIPGGVHGRFPPAEMDRAYDAIEVFLADVLSDRGSPTPPPGTSR
jgi:acetyl esterase/lipase